MVSHSQDNGVIDSFRIDSTAALDEIEKEVRYPRFIKEDQEFLDRVSRVHDEHDRYHLSWGSGKLLAALKDNELEDEDKYELKYRWDILLNFWRSHISFALSDDRDCDHDPDVCAGVDMLIREAFQFRGHGEHRYRTRRILVLPHAPEPSTFEIGGIAQMQLPNEWRDVEMHSNEYVFMVGTDVNPCFDIVTFVFESGAYSQDAHFAVRRIALGMCVAQNQRRALGLDDQDLYGAVLIRESFRIYVSRWEKRQEYQDGNLVPVDKVVRPDILYNYASALREHNSKS
ncbi:hypothetical protein AX16_008319 [Volvariella volvacea WC 439]|nr:hypothetical protein AX16_008319 [Volvariella volvacea WC 439]